jgi:protein-S-isoprenylcysteine O-methyltransferase Ste14
LVVTATGGALYLWTIVLFAKARGTQVPIVPTQALVTSGPYAVTRNPMLTSGVIMVCGGALLFDSWSFMVGGFVIPAAYLLYVKVVEERELEARFGEAYLSYKRCTPFIVPRPTKRPHDRTPTSPSGRRELQAPPVAEPRT